MSHRCLVVSILAVGVAVTACESPVQAPGGADSGTSSDARPPTPDGPKVTPKEPKVQPADVSRIERLSRVDGRVIKGVGPVIVGYVGAIGGASKGTITIAAGDRALGVGWARRSSGAAAPDVTLTVPMDHQVHGIQDTVFADIDKDGELEVVVLAEVMTGMGPEGAVPFVSPVVIDPVAGKLLRRPAIETRLADAKTAGDVARLLTVTVTVPRAPTGPAPVEPATRSKEADKPGKTGAPE